MQRFEETKKLLNNSTSYYLIAVDMNSKYSYVNQRFSRIFEPIHGNLVGQHYSVTMHPDDQEICRIVSEKAFHAPDQLFPATIRKHDGKGGYVITQWEYKAIFNEKHQPEGIFCIGHDITEFMHTSNALKNTLKSLEQITYIQSHVIRKPIANLMGLSLMLQGMELNTDLKNISKMINESAHELDKIIRNSTDRK